MNDPMTILKADHREVKKMLTTLAESDEGSAREKLTVEVDKALRLHMEVEENILYPIVAQQIGAEDEEEAEIEHGLAREGLAKLAELVAKPGFGAAVEMLKGGIGHHVEEEETELLPALKSSLSRDEWLALGDKIADAKAAAGSPVKTAPRRKSGKRTAKK
jgi:hemerythrin-like domain-containing protein